jgi:hypothetical protein
MHQSRTRLIFAGIAALQLLASCGGGGSSAPANAAPTANAGSAQTVSAGATVTLNGTASSDSDGSIAGYAWTQTAGNAVPLSSASASQPSFTAPSVMAAATLTFRLVVTDNDGAASSGSTVSVTVNPVVVAPVTVTGLVRFSRVPFRTTSPFGLDYASAGFQPSRGVIVQALDAAQNVLDTDDTNASGNYSLSVPGNTSITIKVIARMQRSSPQPLPRWDVRVQDGQLAMDNAYSYTSAAFNSNAGVHDINIPLGISGTGAQNGDRASGPFAVLDTIYAAMQTVLGAAANTNFPALVVDWGSQIEGTFFSTTTAQHIALLADLTEDTDEFDQHVIAHEFGHYLEFNFSRADNIGGSHGAGDRLDMRVAFGEGWGYAFAAIALGDPIARDSYVSAGAQVVSRFNVESNPPTALDGVGCWCSETTVWATLWDLYDNTPAEVNDGVNDMGFQPLWDVLTSPQQRSTPSVTSIFSFTTALKAARPASAAAIDTLVAAQNINSAGINEFATAESNTPFPGLTPLFPTIASGGSVVVRSIDDGGYYNKAGNHAFLRFTPSTTRNYTVTLSTSNAATDRDPDFSVYRSGVEVTYTSVNGVVDDGESSPAQFPETATFNGVAGTTYIIDAYDCSNGCVANPPDLPIQGTQGDYNLTVTIN